MSIPAQGAVGAETAAETVTILYENYRGETAVRRITPIAREWFGSSDWHPEPQWLFTAFDMDKEAFRDFARAGVKAWGQAAVDAALASPRADSDERTAGEDVPLEAVRGILEASATPAQPAGAVPDSLRALSEAATQGEWYTESEKCDGSYGSGEDCGEGYLAYSILTDAEPRYGNPGVIAETSNSTLGVIHEESDEDGFTAWDETARANTAFIVAAVNYVRTLLASHPAGQSAGSGAEDAEFEAAQAAGSILPLEWTLKRLEMVRQSGETNRNIWLRNTAWNAIQWLGHSSAPDSTRTGQGEAEERLIGPNMTPEQEARIAHNLCGEFGPDAVIANASFVKAFYAELYAAARPAAPEAQGAWSFDMEAAPRDGSDVEVVNDRGQFIAQFDRSWGRSYADAGWWMVSDGKDPERPLRGDEPFAWRIPTKAPAPPASSGQEG